MSLALCLFSFSLLYIVLEVLRRRALLRQVVTRKLAHLGSALLILTFYPLLTKVVFLVVTFIFFGLFIFSYRHKILSSVHTSRYTTYGELFFPVGVISTALFFYQAPFIFTTSILVLGIADALAGYYDSFFERKTLSGRLIFLIATVVLLSLQTAHYQIPLSYTTIVLVSTLVTLSEYLSPKGLDNLTIPLSLSVLLSLSL